MTAVEMGITKVRVRMVPNAGGRSHDVTLATIDVEFGESLVVRGFGLRRLCPELTMVRFPSRKLKFPCTGCGCLNAFDARYCNECGVALDRLAHVGLKRGGRTDHVIPVREGATVDLRNVLIRCYQIVLARREMTGDVFFPSPSLVPEIA